MIFIFVVLGANLPLGTMAENLGPGLVVVMALLVIARPLVVVASLLADSSAGHARRGSCLRRSRRS